MAKKKQAVPVLTRERKGSPYRHFDFEVDGQRHTGSTKRLVEDVAGAEKFAAAIRNRLLDEAAAKRVAPMPGPGDKDMTWTEAVASYLAFVGHYPSYVREEVYFGWLRERIGGLSVRDIDDSKLRALVSERRNKDRYDLPHLGKLSNSAVNCSVTSLVQKVLRHVKLEGMTLPREPHYRKHFLAVKHREREMVIDEEILLEGVRPDVWPCINFILATGLRKGPALIRWSQVHWRQGVIHVVGKGNKFQEVPITEEVEEILKAEWGKHPTFVFTFKVQQTFVHKTTRRRHMTGEILPLTYGGLVSIWNGMCRKAGVTNLHIHDIRKTTGARIVRTTGDLVSASKVLNHANIALTARHYTHITSQDVRKRLAQTQAETRRLKASWAPVRELE